MVRASRESSASFLGGKNSNEYVLPAASKSAILVTPAFPTSARPKSSSSRTMSSSPKYVPCCTSMKTTSVSPSLAMRWADSSGMSMA